MLAAARGRLDDIGRRVKSPENLALFAELWRDRETAAMVAAARPPASWPSTKPARPLHLAEGQRVQHARFGPGVVETITAAGDPQITIVFDSGEQRTFLASLVVDKLQAL